MLTPNGRISIGIPGPTPPLIVDLRDVLAARIGTDAASFVNAVFSLHDPTELRGLLDRAGSPRLTSDPSRCRSSFAAR
ncbi:MAG: hypothetical protein HKN07_06160 [Acidimicrobiia bacterium]|nr:hypothetical protein [Acidimicrobiia bacterium]